MNHDNIYTILNDELARMHDRMSRESNVENVNIWWNKVKEIQDALLEALKSQPSHHDEIKDLQDTLSDLILTGTDSK